MVARTWSAAGQSLGPARTAAAPAAARDGRQLCASAQVFIELYDDNYLDDARRKKRTCLAVVRANMRVLNHHTASGLLSELRCQSRRCPMRAQLIARRPHSVCSSGTVPRATASASAQLAAGRFN